VNVADVERTADEWPVRFNEADRTSDEDIGHSPGYIADLSEDAVDELRAVSLLNAGRHLLLGCNARPVRGA
jgi:hypothetical protein